MVVHEILEECHEGQFDLLVLGQHLAEADAGGPLTENIAEILAMECPIPLVIVRPRRSSGEVGRTPASGVMRD
jgi:nucleotide-binding universal stress UspA family protein